MEAGNPISYEVLETGTPVLDSSGAQFGTVKKVLAAEEEDIFEGLIVHTPHGDRFVYAESIDSIHEHAVSTTLDAAAAVALPQPEPAPGEVELTPDDISESEGRYKFGMFFRRIWNRLSGNY